MISFWKRSELDKIRRSKYLLPSDRLASNCTATTTYRSLVIANIIHIHQGFHTAREKTTYASIKVIR